MKIVCPSCAATYEVPEAVLAARRPVRCARCGNNWTPGGEAEEAPAPEPVAEVASQMPVVPAPPAVAPPVTVAAPPETRREALAEVAVAAPAVQPQRAAPVVAAKSVDPAEMVGDKPPLTGWIISIAVLVSLAAGSLVFREPIMHAWPASKRAYGWVGLYQPH
jgi:predicted Zn finger-like uncharacterized protein